MSWLDIAVLFRCQVYGFYIWTYTSWLLLAGGFCFPNRGYIVHLVLVI